MGDNDVFLGIEKAQEAAKTAIQDVGKKANLTSEEWISQAKKIQADIESSRATARRIVKQAQHAESLRAKQTDIDRKGELLRSEVAFNIKLQSVLEQFRKLQIQLASAQEATKNGNLQTAFEQLENIEEGFENLRGINNTTALQLLQERVRRLRQTLESDTQKLFLAFLEVLVMQQCMILKNTTDSWPGWHLKEATSLCARLNTLESDTGIFSSNLDVAIIDPLLVKLDRQRESYRRVEIKGNRLSLVHTDEKPTVSDILNDVTNTLSFLSRNVPSQLFEILSEMLLPTLIHRLLSRCLLSTIDTRITSIPEFEETLKQTSVFAEELTAKGWSGTADVNEWIESAPRIWISKRRETSLVRVNTALKHHISQRQNVERVETQTLSQDDLRGAPAGATEDNEWDNNWEEDEPRTQDEIKVSPKREPEEEEDASAWEIDDNAEATAQPTKPINGSQLPRESNESQEQADETDAWDWHEDDTAPESPVSPQSPSNDTARNKARPLKAKGSEQGQEITLREKYTVTGIPGALHELIAEVCDDAKALQTEPYNKSSVAPAASALRSFPSLTLASYRALAPTYYQPVDGGNMLLYNDAMRLAETLSSFQNSSQTSSKGSVSIDMTSDACTLESFARRAYGKEMDSQRTIIRDLLGLAQGFANCTEQPFANACKDAISATVDHITGLHRQWTKILSQSALLQSIGSLLQTAIQKIIVDIEDLSDIGEDESTQLRKHCDDLMKLNSLFLQHNPTITAENARPQDQQSPSDTTPLYVPNWFKLQHLAEILESKLADIKYFWSEGDLKLDFEKDELIELIEALFAESELRRQAIGEIRRS